MSTADSSDSFGVLREQFDEAARAGDLGPVRAALTSRLAAGVAAGDEVQLSALGRDLARLDRRARSSDLDVAVLEAPVLRRMMATVRSALAEIDYRRDVAELLPTTGERVLDMVGRTDRPLGPAAVARSLGMSRVQASRVLQSLCADGLLRPVRTNANELAISYEGIARSDR